MPQNPIDDVAIAFERSSPPALAGLSLNRQQSLQNTQLDLAVAAQGCVFEAAALNQNKILGLIDFIHAVALACLGPKNGILFTVYQSAARSHKRLSGQP